MESAPLRETLRTHGGAILKVVGAIVFGTALTYLLIFLPTYLTEVIGLSQTRALAANLVGVAALLILCPTAALLSERVGRKPFLVGSALGTAILAILIFLLLQGSYAAILVAHVCVGGLIGLFGGAYPAAFSELFPTKVRYTARSLWATASASPSSGGSRP